jgi:hypothetical protein
MTFALVLVIATLALINRVACAYPGKENATMIQLNMPVTLSVTQPPGYFKFVLSTLSFVAVQASRVNSSSNSSSLDALQVDLIDLNETFFGSAGSTIGAELSAVLPAGTFILYVPNAIASFNLSVYTSVCGEKGVAAPPPTNLDIATAIDVNVTSSDSDSYPIWFCPPNVPKYLFFRLRASTPGTATVSLETGRSLAPIWDASLTLLTDTGDYLTSCGTSFPSCSVLFDSTDTVVIARVSRNDASAGGRVWMEFSFEMCTADEWEPNGLPPATPVSESGSLFVNANLCRGDHDFFELPRSPGAKIIGARMEGSPAEWVLRVFQRIGTTGAKHDDLPIASNRPVVDATNVGAWVLLPETAEQVYLEVLSDDARAKAPFYNLSVAIGVPFEIDLIENNATTAMTTRKSDLLYTGFYATNNATVIDQVQKIFNALGGLVPVVHSISSKSMGLLLPTSNLDKVTQVEAMLRTKLADKQIVERFEALGLRLDLGTSSTSTTLPTSTKVSKSSSASIQMLSLMHLAVLSFTLQIWW